MDTRRNVKMPNSKVEQLPADVENQIQTLKLPYEVWATFLFLLEHFQSYLANATYES